MRLAFVCFLVLTVGLGPAYGFTISRRLDLPERPEAIRQTQLAPVQTTTSPQASTPAETAASPETATSQTTTSSPTTTPPTTTPPTQMPQNGTTNPEPAPEPQQEAGGTLPPDPHDITVSVTFVAALDTGATPIGLAPPARFPSLGAMSTVGAITAPALGSANTVMTNVAAGFEANLGTRFYTGEHLLLGVELPLVFVPGTGVHSDNPVVASSYSSLFFTPSLRFTGRVGRRSYPPDSKHPSGYAYNYLYPWVSAGGGLAYFHPSGTGQAGKSSNAIRSAEGAFQVGVGIDFKPGKAPLGLRIEARDFYAASPNLGVSGVTFRHNITAAAGLILYFGK